VKVLTSNRFKVDLQPRHFEVEVGRTTSHGKPSLASYFKFCDISNINHNTWVMNQCKLQRGSASRFLRLVGQQQRYAAFSQTSAAAKESVARALKEPVAQTEQLSTATASKTAAEDSKQFKKRDLPISPLMDADRLAARQKHRTGKADPSREPTLLQRKLVKSPYGK
jgi:hypothetical protein